MISVEEVFKRLSYAKVRLSMHQTDQALGALIYGLPPTVKRPERSVKAPTGKIIQVEARVRRVTTFRQALDRYGDMVRREAKAAGVPVDLGLAFCWVESTFDPTAYRYEPAWDRWYIHEKSNGLDIESPPYNRFAMQKITIGEWFVLNPKRIKEKRANKSYNYFAQLRIAASYGFIQVMHASAVGEGLKTKPESMYTPRVGLEIGFAHFNRKRRRRGYTMMDAIAAYNAGSARRKNDGTYKNQYYVSKIQRARTAFKKLV